MAGDDNQAGGAGPSPVGAATRVIQWATTGLFSVVAGLCMLLIGADLAERGEFLDGLGVGLGLMGLAAILAMAVPLILSWALPRAPDGARAVLALSSTTMLLIGAIALVLNGM